MRSRVRYAILGITWLIATLIVVQHRRDVFYDVDEGLLGETAERVMHGQLAHRDFVDVYTGALGVIDAAGFRVWGISAETLRTVLVVATVLWIPVFFVVAERLARPGPWAPWAAGLAVITAVYWSVPNHPRGMPTWYTLFFATAGMAAVLRYIDTRHRRWMLAAGVAAGLSCTIKIVGLYFIGAVLLFAVFDEQETAAASRAARGVSWYSLLIDGVLVAFVAAVVWLVRSQGSTGLVHFAVPAAAMAGLLMWREHRGVLRPPPLVRFERVMQALVPFAVGVAIPVAVFVVPYARSGALGALLRGVFVTPTVRITGLTLPLPPAVTVLAAVPLVAALGLIGRRWPTRVVVSALALVVLAATGLLQPYPDPALRTPLHVASRLARDAERGMIPFLVVVGVVLVARGRTVIDARAVVLVLAVLATGTLVQFPYALDQYFLFVAPLVVLAAMALSPTRAAAVVAVACMVFAVARFKVVDDGPMVRLDIPRGGPLVSPDINDAYRTLVATVHAHARGQYIYAGPDSPQVYFLTGYQNPTGTLYEMFDDTTGHTARVLQAIEAHGVNTIVINTHPGTVSGPMAPALRAALTTQYPDSATVGAYIVRWR
jgi:hypothetical protein